MIKRGSIKLRETSAGGVVFRGGEVLHVQRRTGEWVFPKGHLEEGESKDDAAAREVQEETGLLVDVLEPLGTTQYRFSNDSGRVVNKTVHWFLMECKGGELAVEPLFRQARFVLPEEALRLLTFANDRALLSRALERHFAVRRGGPRVMHRNTDQERHDRLARKTARILNSISMPGVGPMNWRERLTVLLVLGLAAGLIVAMILLAGRSSG